MLTDLKISNLPAKKQFLRRYLESLNSNLVISNVCSLHKSTKSIWRPFDDLTREKQTLTEVAIPIDEETSTIDTESDTNSLKTDSLSEINLSDITDIDDLPETSSATSTPVKRNLQQAKRQRLNEANQKLNEKYINLMINRAKERNQMRVICRYYKCNKCNFKSYIKKVVEHHINFHPNASKNDITIASNVFRRAN